METAVEGPKKESLIKIDNYHALIRLDNNRTVALIRIPNPAKTWPAEGESLKKRLKYIEPSSKEI
jgi:hypothetical protein